jgi:hypothetical protein
MPSRMWASSASYPLCVLQVILIGVTCVSCFNFKAAVSMARQLLLFGKNLSAGSIAKYQINNHLDRV